MAVADTDARKAAESAAAGRNEKAPRNEHKHRLPHVLPVAER